MDELETNFTGRGYQNLIFKTRITIHTGFRSVFPKIAGSQYESAKNVGCGSETLVPIDSKINFKLIKIKFLYYIFIPFMIFDIGCLLSMRIGQLVMFDGYYLS